MRLHVVSLPHTQTTNEFAACAYTAKVRGFCRMMMSLGHEVYLYAGEKNDAPCTELIPCLSEAERTAAVGSSHYTSASFDWNLPHWRKFNRAAADHIRARAQKRDFLCVIAGIAHKPIADAIPEMTCCEFGVGYGGTFTKFRCFESYAWMHTSYGARHPNDPHAVDGAWFDAVIPGYLDPDEFPYRGNHRRENDYYLYVGRMIERKGIHIAAEMCQIAGKRLVMAGPGMPPPGVEYVGVVDPIERGQLMSGARALIMPTIYIEPFGNVAIEAMACGTPVICTDWGAMTETVLEGVTGFRCRTMAEFIAALDKVKDLDPRVIRRHIVRNYSLPVIATKYQQYFERLDTLWEKGWYELAA